MESLSADKLVGIAVQLATSPAILCVRTCSVGTLAWCSLVLQRSMASHHHIFETEHTTLHHKRLVKRFEVFTPLYRMPYIYPCFMPHSMHRSRAKQCHCPKCKELASEVEQRCMAITRIASRSRTICLDYLNRAAGPLKQSRNARKHRRPFLRQHVLCGGNQPGNDVP